MLESMERRFFLSFVVVAVVRLPSPNSRTIYFCLIGNMYASARFFLLPYVDAWVWHVMSVVGAREKGGVKGKRKRRKSESKSWRASENEARSHKLISEMTATHAHTPIRPKVHPITRVTRRKKNKIEYKWFLCMFNTSLTPLSFAAHEAERASVVCAVFASSTRKRHEWNWKITHRKLQSSRRRWVEEGWWLLTSE